MTKPKQNQILYTNRNVYVTSHEENRVVDSEVVDSQIVSQQILTASSYSSSKQRNLNRRELLEQGLVKARATILKAASNRNTTVFKIDLPDPEIYRNPSSLYQSYLEMEKRFKVYLYEEGEPPLVQYGPSKSVYAVEGRFIAEMEKNNKFRTYDPDQAHVYFLPFSVAWLVKYLYNYNNNVDTLRTVASDYIRLVSTNHHYWNRSNGADHFMVACHDWGPMSSM